MLNQKISPNQSKTRFVELHYEKQPLVHHFDPERITVFKNLICLISAFMNSGYRMHVEAKLQVNLRHLANNSTIGLICGCTWFLDPTLSGTVPIPSRLRNENNTI